MLGSTRDPSSSPMHPILDPLFPALNATRTQEPRVQKVVATGDYFLDRQQQQQTQMTMRRRTAISPAADPMTAIM